MAMSRGFYAIGVYKPKKEVNIGTLWRTANILGASLIFTAGVSAYMVALSDGVNVVGDQVALPVLSFFNTQL